MLRGEILYREGSHAAAFATLTGSEPESPYRERSSSVAEAPSASRVVAALVALWPCNLNH